MITLPVPRMHLQKIIVRTHTPGIYDGDGEFVEPTPTETEVLASVQPAKPEDLQNLPDGMDPFDTWVVHCTVHSFIERTVDQLPDQIQHLGKWYTLVSLKDYKDNAHTRGMFSRYDRTRS